MSGDRKLAWDWYSGSIPANVEIDERAYVETSYSFLLFRSQLALSVKVGRGTSIYLGTMFDVGPRGKVLFGDYVLMNGARIICDSEVTIGDYCLISWNVVLMDTYRMPFDAIKRREELRLVPTRKPRVASADVPSKPIQIGANVWIGFDVCVLPGVKIGEGSVIGARSVVAADVPPYTIAAGNPARIIRNLEPVPPAHA